MRRKIDYLTDWLVVSELCFTHYVFHERVAGQGERRGDERGGGARPGGERSVDTGCSERRRWQGSRPKGGPRRKRNSEHLPQEK